MSRAEVCWQCWKALLTYSWVQVDQLRHPGVSDTAWTSGLLSSLSWADTVGLEERDVRLHNW